jgi:hypothetical protein
MMPLPHWNALKSKGASEIRSKKIGHIKIVVVKQSGKWPCYVQVRDLVCHP